MLDVKDMLDCWKYQHMSWINNYIGSMGVGDWADAGVVVLDVQDLVDGRNPIEPVWQKIKTGLAILELGNKLCVRCTAGISRSNSIAVGIITVKEKIPFTDALELCKKKVPRMYPNPYMLESVLKALKAYRPHMGK